MKKNKEDIENIVSWTLVDAEYTSQFYNIEGPFEIPERRLTLLVNKPHQTHLAKQRKFDCATQQIEQKISDLIGNKE